MRFVESLDEVWKLSAAPTVVKWQQELAAQIGSGKFGSPVAS